MGFPFRTSRCWSQRTLWPITSPNTSYPPDFRRVLRQPPLHTKLDAFPGNVSARRLLAPDGHYEHVPLRLVTLEQDDLEILSAAVRGLSTATSASARAQVTDPAQRQALAEVAGLLGQKETNASTEFTPPENNADLLRPLARLVAVLDLAPDADTQLLEEVLRAHSDGDVALTAGQEAAYQRLVSRINLVQNDADATARFLY